MVWRFDPTEMKSVDLRSAAAGDILCPLKSAAPPDLWLRLSGDEHTQTILHLSGSKEMHVWPVQTQYPVPTLLIAKGEDLRLEIAGEQGVKPRVGRAGELVFTEDAAYFVALMDARGFPEECYVSLADWSVRALHQITPVNVSFSAWRLVRARSQGESEILFSAGDWTNSGT